VHQRRFVIFVDVHKYIPPSLSLSLYIYIYIYIYVYMGYEQTNDTCAAESGEPCRSTAVHQRRFVIFVDVHTSLSLSLYMWDTNR